MIEGLFIYFLWGKVADKVYAKGYDKTLKYQLLLVFAWPVGEFLGFVIWVATSFTETGNNNYFLAYLAAFSGALIGVGLVFWRISKLPQISFEPEEGQDWRHQRVRR